MNRFNIWRVWLVLACLLVSLFGLAMALGGRGEPLAFFTQRVDAAFWGAGGPPPQAIAFQHWVYGAWGATVAGWGLMMAFMAWVAWGRKEPWARGALVASLALWFLVDTGFSLYFGVWINAGLNLLLLIILGLPVAASWRDFKPND